MRFWVTDDWAKAVKTIGQPYIREWFTYTCDENGDVPPQEEWVNHRVEVVIIETSELKELVRLANLARLKLAGEVVND